jgi:hypothetical protein
VLSFFTPLKYLLPILKSFEEAQKSALQSILNGPNPKGQGMQGYFHFPWDLLSFLNELVLECD